MQVIHRGNLAHGRNMMAPYLPREGAQSSPYPEGGALFALGLIYVNHGHDIKPFLLQVSAAMLRKSRHAFPRHVRLEF